MDYRKFFSDNIGGFELVNLVRRPDYREPINILRNTTDEKRSCLSVSPICSDISDIDELQLSDSDDPDAVSDNRLEGEFLRSNDERDPCSTSRRFSPPKIFRSLGEQSTRTPPWPKARGDVGIGGFGGSQLKLSDTSSTLGDRFDDREEGSDERNWRAELLEYDKNFSRTKTMSEQIDRRLSDTNLNVGGVLPQSLRRMQSIQRELLSMHEQLHPPPNSGLLPTIQSRYGSVSLPLQSILRGSIPKDDELFREMKIVVSNIRGDKRSVTGCAESLLKDLCGLIDIYPPIITLPSLSQEIDPLDGVYLIHHGVKHRPSGRWKTIGINDGDKLHIVRYYDKDVSTLLKEKKKIDILKDVEERSIGVQADMSNDRYSSLTIFFICTCTILTVIYVKFI